MVGGVGKAPIGIKGAGWCVGACGKKSNALLLLEEEEEEKDAGEAKLFITLCVDAEENAGVGIILGLKTPGD